LLVHGDAVGLSRSEPVKVASVYSCARPRTTKIARNLAFLLAGPDNRLAHRFGFKIDGTSGSALVEFSDVSPDCFTQGVEVVATLQTRNNTTVARALSPFFDDRCHG